MASLHPLPRKLCKDGIPQRVAANLGDDGGGEAEACSSCECIAAVAAALGLNNKVRRGCG